LRRTEAHLVPHVAGHDRLCLGSGGGCQGNDERRAQKMRLVKNHVDLPFTIKTNSTHGRDQRVGRKSASLSTLELTETTVIRLGCQSVAIYPTLVEYV
jgi:hypothetical protein